MIHDDENKAMPGRSEIERYRRDGVVHLRDAFDVEWLELLRRGIGKNLKNPSPRFEARTTAASAARYCEDFWVWSMFTEFETFVRDSPAARMAAGLMGARHVNLVMDNWFLREPGAQAHAPWHHDISYFDFDGSMCVLWLPLQPSRQGEGIQFVRGSHLWNRLFMRVLFDGHRPAADASIVNGELYEDPPEIDGNEDRYDILSYDLEPGDCLFFDIRTLHGSRSAAVPETLQSRYTLRLATQDARIKYRGEWALQERRIFEEFGHRNGDELNSEFFPELWNATSGTLGP